MLSKRGSERRETNQRISGDPLTFVKFGERSFESSQSECMSKLVPVRCLLPGFMSWPLCFHQGQIHLPDFKPSQAQKKKPTWKLFRFVTPPVTTVRFFRFLLCPASDGPPRWHGAESKRLWNLSRHVQLVFRYPDFFPSLHLAFSWFLPVKTFPQRPPVGPVVFKGTRKPLKEAHVFAGGFPYLMHLCRMPLSAPFPGSPPSHPACKVRRSPRKQEATRAGTTRAARAGTRTRRPDLIQPGNRLCSWRRLASNMAMVVAEKGRRLERRLRIKLQQLECCFPWSASARVTLGQTHSVLKLPGRALASFGSPKNEEGRDEEWIVRKKALCRAECFQGKRVSSPFSRSGLALPKDWAALRIQKVGP